MCNTFSGPRPCHNTSSGMAAYKTSWCGWKGTMRAFSWPATTGKGSPLVRPSPRVTKRLSASPAGSGAGTTRRPERTHIMEPHVMPIIGRHTTPAHQPATAVFLLNFGGPQKATEVEPFLVQIFEDRYIIRAPLG